MVSQYYGNSVLLQLPGRLDLQGGLKFQHQLTEIIPEQLSLWLIDMAEVEFIDSSGLLYLIDGLKLANHHCCRMIICNLRPQIKLIFEIARLDDVFEIIDNYEIPVTTTDQKKLLVPSGQGAIAA